MQSLRLLALISGLSALNFSFSGCSTTRGTIEAATTKIEIQQGKNKGFSVAFPKELQATKLDVSIDPKSGAITIKADELKSSSTGIIESAGIAQAQAMQAMSATLNTALSALMPFLARAATGIDFPAIPPAPAPVPEPPPVAIPVPATPPVITPIAPLDLSALNLAAK